MTVCSTPVDPGNFAHYFHRLCARVDLRHWTPHELHHSAASIMPAQDTPLYVASEVLGPVCFRILCSKPSPPPIRILGLTIPKSTWTVLLGHLGSNDRVCTRRNDLAGMVSTAVLARRSEAGRGKRAYPAFHVPSREPRISSFSDVVLFD